MIKGIGIDVVNIRRIKNRISLKILSEEELVQFNNLESDKRKKEYLAGRFAIKEALYKASGTKLTYKDVSIINDEYGKPIINYSNAFCSISHDGDYVIGIVIIE